MFVSQMGVRRMQQGGQCPVCAGPTCWVPHHGEGQGRRVTGRAAPRGRGTPSQAKGKKEETERKARRQEEATRRGEEGKTDDEKRTLSPKRELTRKHKRAANIRLANVLQHTYRFFSWPGQNLVGVSAWAGAPHATRTRAPPSASAAAAAALSASRFFA